MPVHQVGQLSGYKPFADWSNIACDTMLHLGGSPVAHSY